MPKQPPQVYSWLDPRLEVRNSGGGVEITFDYAMVMHSSEESTTYFKMPCLCGAKNCRGFIAEDDWQRPELQSRYDSWFQWFLQEKIEKQRR